MALPQFKPTRFNGTFIREITATGEVVVAVPPLEQEAVLIGRTLTAIEKKLRPNAINGTSAEVDREITAVNARLTQLCLKWEVQEREVTETNRHRQLPRSLQPSRPRWLTKMIQLLMENQAY